MALDARHRSSIYGKLVPVLGEDDANALMTEFPSIEADELVTKQFLRAELAEFRGEMSELRTEFRGETSELRSEFSGEIGSVRGEIADLRTEMHGEFARVHGEFARVHGQIAGLRADMAELRTDLTLRTMAAIAAATAVLGTLNLIG